MVVRVIILTLTVQCTVGKKGWQWVSMTFDWLAPKNPMHRFVDADIPVVPCHWEWVKSLFC